MSADSLDPELLALSQGQQPSAPAVAAQSASGLHPELAALAQGNSRTQAETKADNSPASFGRFIGREAVRIPLQAAAALPGMAMDLGVGTRNIVGDAYNKLTGQPATPDYQLPSSMFNQALDSYVAPPTGTANRVAEGFAGGALGGRMPIPMIANAAPAAFAPAAAKAASNLTGAQQQALAAGQNIGMRATPGQQAGSTALQQLEAKLQSQPWTSGPFSAITGNNTSVLNRTAAQAIGENSPTLDSTVLARANERLGNVFQNVRSADRIVQADPQATRGGVLDGINSLKLKGCCPQT